jgi:hypothetical protein
MVLTLLAAESVQHCIVRAQCIVYGVLYIVTVLVLPAAELNRYSGIIHYISYILFSF